MAKLLEAQIHEEPSFGAPEPFAKVVQSMQGKNNREAKRKSKQSEEKQRGQQLQSSFALLEDFPKSIFYMLYTISKLRKLRIQRFKPCTIWSWNEENMAFGSQLLQACAKISHDTLCYAKFAQHLQNSHSPCVVRILLCFCRLHFRYFPMYFLM